jgi:hypothetical protein
MQLEGFSTGGKNLLVRDIIIQTDNTISKYRFLDPARYSDSVDLQG